MLALSGFCLRFRLPRRKKLHLSKWTMTVTNLRRAWLALCMVLALAGCGTRGQQATPTSQTKPAPQMKPAPPTPIAEKKEELGDPGWNPDWDKFVEEALPPDMLSAKAARDARPFCPRFATMGEVDKRAFWAYFFQALAGAEAGLKPTTDVRHTEPEVAVLDKITHRITRQEGLLQLTYEDSDRYNCEFDWDNDKQLPEHDASKTILQPKNNLLCGIKILKNQLIDLDEPLLTPKSYWATLRPGTVS